MEVRFFDAASGLNKESLKIDLVDSRGMPQDLEGLNLSSSDEKTAYAVTYPSIDLAPGSYVLSASASDLEEPVSNIETGEIAFTVIVGLPEPVIVEDTPSEATESEVAATPAEGDEVDDVE